MEIALHSSHMSGSGEPFTSNPMKHAVFIVLIFAASLKADMPAGATDLVPRTDSPAGENLKIKDEPAPTTTYSKTTVLSPEKTDIAALEKRIAALEEQVASLKKQLASQMTADSSANLAEETRRRSVAEEVRRRRAKRDAYEAQRAGNTTTPNQASETTTTTDTPPPAQEPRNP